MDREAEARRIARALSVEGVSDQDRYDALALLAPAMSQRVQAELAKVRSR